jgi:hypothetical protein
MTHALKNKVNFYQLAGEFGLEGFCPPDYTVSNIYDLTRTVTAFLSKVEEIYKQAGVAAAYPLGVILRAAESDGNYGCCLVYENHHGIVVVPNGDVDPAQRCPHCPQALDSTTAPGCHHESQRSENRISRYIDFGFSRHVCRSDG